jgi:membrane associated rhomboid family serine protease
MLEDRHYMRGNPFRTHWWSTTVLLIAANVITFIGQLIVRNSWPESDRFLALSVDGLRHGYLWQLLTFQFLHGGFWHLFFNCLAIFMFGRDVEQALGRKSFLTLYIGSGVVGGVLQVIFSKVLAILLHTPQFEFVRVVGASAGAFGLVAAFATLYPERPIMLLIYFIPVNMRAKFLLLFEGLFTLFGILIALRQWNIPGAQVAHAAHLGGMLAGIWYIRYAARWEWPQLHRPRKRRVHKLVKVPSQTSLRWGQKRAGAEDLPPDEFLSREVDPILEKISAQGIQSLTESERRILQAARDKVAKR